MKKKSYVVFKKNKIKDVLNILYKWRKHVFLKKIIIIIFNYSFLFCHQKKSVQKTKLLNSY